jgi:hypothetical protein
MEGIAKAQAAGVYKGRKPSVPVEKIKRLRDEGISPSEISRRLRAGPIGVSGARHGGDPVRVGAALDGIERHEAPAP